MTRLGSLFGIGLLLLGPLVAAQHAVAGKEKTVTLAISGMT